MAVRTVRLDDDTEKVLETLKGETGLSVSTLLKRGIFALQSELSQQRPSRTAFEIYEELDLGPGGFAIAPSTETRRGVQEAIRKKLNR